MEILKECIDEVKIYDKIGYTNAFKAALRTKYPGI